jgi:hypothetical protein
VNDILTAIVAVSFPATSTSLKEITNSSSLLIFHFNPLTSFQLTVTFTSLVYLSASIALPPQVTVSSSSSSGVVGLLKSSAILSSVKVNPLTKIVASLGAFTLNLATS